MVLLSLLQLSAEGRPLTSGCSQTSEIELYYPTDPGAKNTCVPCPECPEGQGLTPQCGSRVPSDTKIECTPCKADVSYSDSHGIESCKACHECGLKNVIQHCTPDKNRKCGTKCPQGYFLDDNHTCQECYFCCGFVRDNQRRQGCIDIGMTRDWQCEKTEQNRHCKEKVIITKPTDTEPTTAPPNHNTMTMTGTHVKTHVHDKFATTLPHQPGQNLTWSQLLSVDGSTPTAVQGTKNMASHLPENDDSANAAQSTKKDKKQEQHGAVSLRVVIGVAIIIFIILILALMTSKRAKQFCRFSGTNQRNQLEGENKTDNEIYKYKCIHGLYFNMVYLLM